MMFTSTIAAISTPPGKGGVAVIRISGADALCIAKKIFQPKGSYDMENLPKRMQIYGVILRDGEEIDDGLITYFAAPNSYTGEDIIEISCHGGMLITRAVLEAAYIAGAAPAERGEFTKRAFINGKLSLVETEAIGMLLEAESDAQIKLSRSKSRSKLKSAVEDIKSSIVSVLSSAFARIDYPEEDLGDFTDDEMLTLLERINTRLLKLIDTYKTGRAVSEGVKTVICGKPNVGKSTLYNLLVGEDAAIVTSIPGTTRDVLEKKVSLGSVMLNLYDTAGIREGGADEVEAIGIDRSREKIDSSELIIALFDSKREIDSEDTDVLEYIKDKHSCKVAVITKCDSACTDTDKVRTVLRKYDFDGIIEISANERGEEAVRSLKSIVENLFTDEKIVIGEDAVISSARQYSSLVRAREYISSAAEAIKIGLPQDAASSDIELALGAISELDGRRVSEEVVSDIFSKFCVGK